MNYKGVQSRAVKLAEKLNSNFVLKLVYVCVYIYIYIICSCVVTFIYFLFFCTVH